jgi:hypothetical protein
VANLTKVLRLIKSKTCEQAFGIPKNQMRDAHFSALVYDKQHD